MTDRKNRLRLLTSYPFDDLDDIGDDPHWNNEKSRELLKEVRALAVVAVVGIEDRHQRSGVDENH